MGMIIGGWFCLHSKGMSYFENQARSGESLWGKGNKVVFSGKSLGEMLWNKDETVQCGVRGTVGNDDQSWQHPNHKVCRHWAGQLTSEGSGEAKHSPGWTSLPVCAFCYQSAYLIIQLFVLFPNWVFLLKTKDKTRLQDWGWMVPLNLDPHYLWGRKLVQSFSVWVLCLIILVNDVWLQVQRIHS